MSMTVQGIRAYRCGIWTGIGISLAVLLVAGLLWGLLFWVAQYRRMTTLQSTGDELFDAYLKLQVKQQFPNYFAGVNSRWIKPLSEDKMEALLDSYGPSPEYWQLRVLNRINYRIDDVVESTNIVGQAGSEEEQILEDARKAGQSDFSSDSLLLKLRLARLGGDIKAPADLASSINRHPQAIDPQKRGSTSMSSLDSPKYIALENSELQVLHELHPEQAWPCYRLALNCFRAGEMESGWDWLARGNAASECDSMEQPFPISALRDGLARGSSPGNDYIAYLLYGGSIAWEQPSFINMKRGVRAAAFDARAARDYVRLDALETLACRMGAGSEETITALVAVVLRNMVLHPVMQDLGGELAPEQRLTLLRQCLASNNVKLDVRSFRAVYDDAEGEAYKRLGGWFPASGFEAVMAIQQEEFSEVLPKMRERFEKMKAFDLRTMTVAADGETAESATP
ncbi:hypothetical protein IT575_01565 [bacterium]|nr:hypothetical protein [bacterium]